MQIIKYWINSVPTLKITNTNTKQKSTSKKIQINIAIYVKIITCLWILF